MSSIDHTIKLKDGRRLGYAEYGDPKGKPVFFFHGWPSSRMHASYYHQAAKKLRARIISPDRPGVGLSDFKPKRTLLAWADDVLELANQLQIRKFSVIGISGGGPYAAVCAFKIPQKIKKVGIVVGLAPTNIKGNLDDIALLNKTGWANYHRYPLLANLSAFLGLLETKYLPFSFSVSFVSKQDRRMLTRSIKDATGKNRKQAFKQGYKGPALDLKLYTSNWGFKLNKIKSKVFLWYGDADKNVSLNMGKYYASQIPNSKLIIYPNEGHFLQITHAEEILRTLI
jgi:pimeloyl-ACP methyl ester carboxylesterase